MLFNKNVHNITQSNVIDVNYDFNENTKNVDTVLITLIVNVKVNDMKACFGNLKRDH